MDDIAVENTQMNVIAMRPLAMVLIFTNNAILLIRVIGKMIINAKHKYIN